MSVVRGDSHMYFTPASTALELMQSGKVRALAVATAKRVPEMPDVPTLAEAGLANFSYDSWFGLMAPAGTPAAIIDKVNKDTVEALQDPVLRDRMAKQGGVVVIRQLAGQVRRDHQERYRSLHQDLRSGRNRREITTHLKRRPHACGRRTAFDLRIWCCCVLAARLCAAVWNRPKSLCLQRVLFLIT